MLATGTGSLILSHVNDPGFWLIQSFFKLELKETLATWTVMETVLSVAGLGTTLLSGRGAAITAEVRLADSPAWHSSHVRSSQIPAVLLPASARTGEAMNYDL